MARSGGRGFLVAVVAALTLLVTPLPALAIFDFAIEILGPSFTLTVHDNLAGDLDPVPRQMLVSTSIPGFFNVVVGIGQSVDGAPSSLLDLLWTLSSIGGAGGSVQITASAIDYTFPPSAASSILSSTVSGNAGGGSVKAQQWVDLANGLFVLGAVTPGEQGPFTPAGFTNVASTPFTSATPYSITDRLQLTLGPGAVMGGDLTSTVVPEPVTMFLGGTGLLMLTYAARRRLFGR